VITYVVARRKQTRRIRRWFSYKEDGLSSYWLIIYIVLFIAIFYFMAIRPQQKQRRAHAELMSSLKKGDRVMTGAGIYGTVKRVEESIVVVEIAKGVTVKVARRAIAEIIRDSATAAAAAPEAPSAIGGRRGSATSKQPTFDETEPEDSDASDESSEDTWGKTWRK
jgi:preprotein translocase subunit YajC